MKHFKKGEIKKKKEGDGEERNVSCETFQEEENKKKEEDGEERNVSCETF